MAPHKNTIRLLVLAMVSMLLYIPFVIGFPAPKALDQPIDNRLTFTGPVHPADIKNITFFGTLEV